MKLERIGSNYAGRHLSRIMKACSSAHRGRGVFPRCQGKKTTRRTHRVFCLTQIVNFVLDFSSARLSACSKFCDENALTPFLQITLGWVWLIPAFHMSPDSPSASLVLTRDDIDFAIGIGKAVVDMKISFAWHV